MVVISIKPTHPISTLQSNEGLDQTVDMFTRDDFRMFEFKVRRCVLTRAHDWTECPYAHPGEKARRRDPRKFYYSGDPCPDYRKGSCMKGDVCEYAHGVFECWLHPARYRTQWCKDGPACRRRVCFFAHTFQQLRLTVTSELPSRLSNGGSMLFSPTSTLRSVSPPFSPLSDSSLVDEMTLSLRGLQVNSGFGSVMNRPDIWEQIGCKTGFVDSWEREEPVMERVESGRYLRAEIYEKLSKHNSFKAC